MKVGVVRVGGEKNAGVRELQMQIEFNTETEFNGRERRFEMFEISDDGK